MQMAHVPSILCAGTLPKNSFCWVDAFIFFGIADVDPQAFPSSDISAKQSFPNAQQTQVVPRDHHPIMQECWQQKELMAPRLPKLNIAVCKAQGDLLLYTCFPIENMISGLKGSCRKSAERVRSAFTSSSVP